MTSFTTDPLTITNGDTFTLRWAAPCGFVTLAQKGKGPFMTLLPSTGSYALRFGLDGYPTATGNTVYEGRIADTATPRGTTVTVLPGCPGGCDDGNPCTKDSCDNGTCQHTDVADGTVCKGTCDVCSKGFCVDDASKCGDASCVRGCLAGACSYQSSTHVCSGTCRVCNGSGKCDTDQASLCGSDASCQTCSSGHCSTWTRWYDIDDPGGTGDWETKSAVDGAYPGQVCAIPINVRCQTLGGIDWQKTGEVVHATPTGGCWCYGAEQPSGQCIYDYEVGFCCP